MAQGSPINDILQMRQQGLSNNQIIQNLQRQGYSNTQIFDAMNQADAKMAVEGTPGTMQQVPSNQQNQDNQQVFTQPPQEVSQPQPQQPEPGAYSYPIAGEQVKTEELVEAIVEEKWEELVKDVNKIVDWKNKVENRLSEIELQLENIKEKYSDLNKSVLGKVNEYDKHIMEIGSDIKAMEKTFSKVLPTFTKNVNELSRVADKFKGGTK